MQTLKTTELLNISGGWNVYAGDNLIITKWICKFLSRVFR